MHYRHKPRTKLAATLLPIGFTLFCLPLHAASNRWSIVPYAGISEMSDQSPTFAGADIATGTSDVALATGFVAGLGLRYAYPDAPWVSELGWEYRSNDATTTLVDGTELPGGNYASNIFYLNGRYALMRREKLTPWVGAGVTWVEEVDLDSENASAERSFSASGAIGLQVMAGVDYDLTEQWYLSAELRYSRQSGLDLNEEGGTGRVSSINYQPVTLGLGVGYRF